MAVGWETRPIPSVYTGRPAFTPRTEKSQKRSKLLRPCSSSRTIQRCSRSGSLKAVSCLRLTVQVFSHGSDRLAIRMQTKYIPTESAAKYLKHIAALTGAEQVCGDSYSLGAGRRHFLVDSKFVRLISRHGKSTCFSVATDSNMPSAELVASALLQLKNNPKLFRKWRKQPGCAFKANGKIFRDA